MFRLKGSQQSATRRKTTAHSNTPARPSDPGAGAGAGAGAAGPCDSAAGGGDGSVVAGADGGPDAAAVEVRRR